MGLMRGTQTVPASRQYPLESRERAVRTYRAAEPKPMIFRMAEDLGVHPEALRGWTRQAVVHPTEHVEAASRSLDRLFHPRRASRLNVALKNSANASSAVADRAHGPVDVAPVAGTGERSAGVLGAVVKGFTPLARGPPGALGVWF